MHASPVPSRYRLLALDVDGTLLDSQHRILPATRAALQRARQAGIELVLATGRRYSRTLPLVQPLGLTVPVVTHGGALVKETRRHTTLERSELAPALLRQIIALVSAAGYEPLVYGDTYLDGFDYYCGRYTVEEPLLDEFLRKNPGCGRHHPRLADDPPPGALAAFAMGTRPAMLGLAASLARHFPGQLATKVLRSPFYQGFMCEIAPAEVNKWTALVRLAARQGIAPEAICAVGDDVNDLEMIEQAGLGVAMGNAPEEVRQRADRVAPSHDEAGLVQVVRWLLEA